MQAQKTTNAAPIDLAPERFLVVNVTNQRVLAGPLSLSGVDRWWERHPDWFGLRVEGNRIVVEYVGHPAAAGSRK
jgi:hypothetical protein